MFDVVEPIIFALSEYIMLRSNISFFCEAKDIYFLPPTSYLSQGSISTPSLSSVISIPAPILPDILLPACVTQL